MLFELFSTNLPFYILTIILFSYIIWSKCLKKGKLKPEDVDDILDIITIFFFIFICLMGILSFISITMTMFSSLSLTLKDLTEIWDGTKTLIPFLICFFIILFIWYYRNKEKTKYDLDLKYNLKQFFISLAHYSLLLAFPVFTFYVMLLLTSLKYTIGIALLVYAIIITVFIVFIFKVLGQSLFNLRTIIKPTRNYKILCGFLILIVVLLCLFSMPSINYEKQVNEGYYIYGHPLSGTAYSKILVPLDIKTFGVLGSLVPLITVDYGKYDIDTSDIASKNFKLLLNKSEEDEVIFINNFEELINYNTNPNKKYNFSNIIIDSGRNMVHLNFDGNIRKENISKITLEGYIKKDIKTLDYSYYDNSPYSGICYGGGCLIQIKIENNLSLPLYIREYNLFNFKNRNVINQSNCKFDNTINNFNLDKETQSIYSECLYNSCELEIYDRKVKERVFHIQLFTDGDVVKVHYVDMLKPITIHMNFSILC